jgi:hypothetical protein
MQLFEFFLIAEIAQLEAVGQFYVIFTSVQSLFYFDTLRVYKVSTDAAKNIFK